MVKRHLTAEQKRLDADLWVIALITLSVFAVYAFLGGPLMRFVTNREIPVVPRLLLNAGVQFGIAGLGIAVVCIWRREPFTQFGLKKENAAKAIAGTVLCFAPLIGTVILSGQWNGYRPLHIFVTDDVLAGGFPLSVLGMALIVVVWGFFEGFNYAVICEKINRRYPPANRWLDGGAIVCAVIGILFHPLHVSFWGMVEVVMTFIALYGMLVVRRQTGNAWGCVFAFCLIWNAF